MTVRERLAAYRHAQEQAANWRKDLATLIREARHEGITLTEAARLAGVTRETAYQHLRKNEEER